MLEDKLTIGPYVNEAFKVALSFPIDQFSKKDILRNYDTYIIINAS